MMGYQKERQFSAFFDKSGRIYRPFWRFIPFFFANNSSRAKNSPGLGFVCFILCSLSYRFLYQTGVSFPSPGRKAGVLSSLYILFHFLLLCHSQQVVNTFVNHLLHIEVESAEIRLG